MDPEIFSIVPYGCNTVPIEKGTETGMLAGALPAIRGRCNTVPIEKGTETGSDSECATACHGCNTVPIEKGTETFSLDRLRLQDPRCNTVPIEKGTETRLGLQHPGGLQLMQHRPHREGD